MAIAVGYTRIIFEKFWVLARLCAFEGGGLGDNGIFISLSVLCCMLTLYSDIGCLQLALYEGIVQQPLQLHKDTQNVQTQQALLVVQPMTHPRTSSSTAALPPHASPHTPAHAPPHAKSSNTVRSPSAAPSCRPKHPATNSSTRGT